MNNKPIKPHKMWREGPTQFTAIPVTYFQSADAAFRKKLGMSPRFPVLVVDLSPASIEALEAKVTEVLWGLGAVDRGEGERVPARAALAAIGIRTTKKGRK